jgi:hypothetical protein
MGYQDWQASQRDTDKAVATANTLKDTADKAIAAANAATASAPMNAAQQNQQRSIVAAAESAIAAYNTAAEYAKTTSQFSTDWFGLGTEFLKSTGLDKNLYTPTTGLSGGSVAPISKTVVNTYYTGSGANRILHTVWSDGTETTSPAPDTTATTTDTAATAADNAKKTAVEMFRAALTEYGLNDLADEVDLMIKNDYSVSQIKIELPKTDAYKTRFPGMQTLKNAGKAITEATYISTEKAYDTVLRAYGLDTKVFGSTKQYGTYIANQVAPTEFEKRVNIAAERVEKNPDVVAALNNYYGVSKSGAISYLLNPELGLDIVQKEARAAEIGAAAAATNFSFGEGQVGAGVAESFINASGTQDLTSLKTEFGKARNMANIQSSLASIENTNYSDLDAVTAVLGQDQQLLLESQRRAAREAARFSGNAGIGTGSLKTESSI